MDLMFTFPKAEQHAFFYEEAHLLLISWERDDKRELYRVADQQQAVLQLDYPGELYRERVMELIKSIFFISVQEEADTNKYVLAAYFHMQDQAYAVYYERDANPPKELIFFRVAEDGHGYGLDVIEDVAEHQSVAQEIEERYASFLHIQ
jgi:hypothetical protein